MPRQENRPLVFSGTFFPVYQRLHPKYIVREEILRFYQIRRHIEDVNDFYRQYLYDDLTEAETYEIVSLIECECEFLHGTL